VSLARESLLKLAVADPDGVRAHHRRRVQAPRAQVRLAQHHRSAQALRVPALELEPPGEEEPLLEQRAHPDNHLHLAEEAVAVAARRHQAFRALLPAVRAEDLDVRPASCT